MKYLSHLFNCSLHAALNTSAEENKLETSVFLFSQEQRYILLKLKVANIRVIKGRYYMTFIHIIRVWNLVSQEITEARNVTGFEVELGRHVTIMTIQSNF